MREATVHDVALGFWYGNNVTVRDEDTVSTSMAVPVVATVVVKGHDIVDDGHGERVGLAGVVTRRQTVHQHCRVWGGATVTGTSLVTGRANPRWSCGELWCCHQGDQQDTEESRCSSTHQ